MSNDTLFVINATVYGENFTTNGLTKDEMKPRPANDSYTLWPNGSCTYPETTTVFTENYYEDCSWWYDWAGLPLTNYRTLRGWWPSLYVSTMLSIAFFGFSLTIRNVYLILLRKDWLSSYKIYYNAGAFIVLFKNIELLFQAECVTTFTYYPDPRKSYFRFNCMNTDGYPFCLFVLNQVITAIGLALPFSYHILSFGLGFYRFLIFHFSGIYSSFGVWMVAPTLLIAFTAAPSVFLFQIGTGLSDYGEQFAYYGNYFHPITYVIADYWTNAGYPYWLVAVFNKMIIGHTLFAGALIILTLSKINSIKTFSLTKQGKEVIFQKELLLCHFLLTLSWICQSFFTYDPTALRYRAARFANFATQNLANWLICLGIPLTINFFTLPERFLPNCLRARLVKPPIIEYDQNKKASKAKNSRSSTNFQEMSTVTK